MSKHPSHQRVNLASLADQVLLDWGLRPYFSEAALQQLELIDEAPVQVTPLIKDLSHWPWCSIDNDDSRDLDQLTLSQGHSNGDMSILVAISDVDSLVKKGSAIDEHALTNTTSVYTSAKIFPMLPEKLSTNLTSLNQGVKRASIVVEMVFNHLGEIQNFDVYQAIVQNQSKLAYDAVSDWLENRSELPQAARSVHGMDAQLKAQDHLAQLLKKSRLKAGALNFETFQPRAEFEGEHITKLTLQPHNRARQLIEEFMIAANECISKFLMQHGGASLRRVVRSPERWARIVEVAHQYQETLPELPDSVALEKFLAKQHQLDPLRFPDLSLVIIKLMGRGEYVVERQNQKPIGHFGLAIKNYTHSTAPNRRYPDLVTIRQVKAILANQDPPYTNRELEDLATHCTSQEDASQKAERHMRKSEAAMLLTSRIGQYFDALVTGVAQKGTWVRIIDPPTEGRLSGDIPKLKVGQRLRVKLIYTSVEKGFIDFVITRSPSF